MPGISGKHIFTISNSERRIYDYKTGTLKEILVSGDKAGSLELPRVGDAKSGLGDANYKPGKDTFEAKEFGSSSDNIPTSNWYHIISMQGDDVNENYVTQLGIGMTTDAVYYRRFHAGTWEPWRKMLFEGDVAHFQSGEVFTINGIMAFAGYLTSASTEIFFTIPLPKSANGRKVSIACKPFTVRYNGGYIINGIEDSGDISKYDIATAISENLLGIRIKKISGEKWIEDNNLPVSVNGEFKISFS